MSTFGVLSQPKVSTQASRGASTTATRASAAKRVSSVATLASFGGGGGNVNASCACGHTQTQSSTDAWDPFQSDCMPPGCRMSSHDLLRSMQQRRAGPAGCQPSPPPPQPCPPRTHCDSGESDATVADNGRRTTEFLYDMFCEQKLCDVVLRCCGGDGNTVDSIHAHKVQTSYTLQACVQTRPACLRQSRVMEVETLRTFRHKSCYSVVNRKTENKTKANSVTKVLDRNRMQPIL